MNIQERIASAMISATPEMFWLGTLGSVILLLCIGLIVGDYGVFTPMWRALGRTLRHPGLKFISGALSLGIGIGGLANATFVTSPTSRDWTPEQCAAYVESIRHEQARLSESPLWSEWVAQPVHAVPLIVVGIALILWSLFDGDTTPPAFRRDDNDNQRNHGPPVGR
jgi:hypothetical protein